ncbi:MAG: GNAT family N-acetyltransferase, cg3035/Rv0428c family, partial [Caulobacteraceae bacterium]
MSSPAILEPIAARAWPSRESSRLGEWTLNAADGWSGRINSAWVLGEADRPAEEAVEAAERWYGARGLSPLFKLIEGDEGAPAGLLAARGYRPGAPTLVMTGSPTALRDPSVRIEAGPLAAFRRIFSAPEFGGAAEAAERLDAFERTPSPRAFAVLEDDKFPAAIGVGAADAMWFGVMGMRTLGAHRRKGLGRRVLRALS